ncbi:conjugal transfer mating pair stabilization protein TraG [Providencia sp. wls1919]|nr:conjugal transfer mating pair stabilization protein TraG [Providencia sp. wls1919]
MYEIYTIGGGDWLANILNPIAAFFKTDQWNYLYRFGLLLSVLVAAGRWISRHDILDLVKWLFTIVFVSILINVKHTVQIIDNTDLKGTYPVANVPVGIVLPAHLTTIIGSGLTRTFESLFSSPDSVTYNKTGMLFGANLIAKSTDFVSQDNYIAEMLPQYVENCVMGDIFLNHKYSMNQLLNSPEPYELIFSNPSPLRGVFDSTNTFRNCEFIAKNLREKIGLDVKQGGKTYHYYARQILGGRPDTDPLFGLLLSGSYSHFYGASKSASEILKQNVTMNAIRDGVTAYSARQGDVAGMLNITSTTAIEKQRLAQAGSYRIATRYLPIMHLILTGIMMALFPVIIVCALLDCLTGQVLKNYVLSFLWLQLWPLLFAVLNNAMTFYSKKNGAEVVLSNFSKVRENFSDIATTAGYLSVLIPFISWGIVKGMGAVFSNVSSSLGSSLLGASTQAASTAVDGNYSYANMQTDNVSGFNWNTNSTFAHGQMQHQTPSGASVTQTNSGHLVFNAGTAMSILPNQINMQRSLAASHQAMARESHQEAQSYQAGFSKSVTSTANQLSNFTSQYGNSASSISGYDQGVSSNATRGISQVDNAVNAVAKDNRIGKDEALQMLIQRSAGKTTTDTDGFDTGVGIPGGQVLGVKLGGSSKTAWSDSDSMNTSQNVSGSQHNNKGNSISISASAMQDFREGKDLIESSRLSESGNISNNEAQTRIDQIAVGLSTATNQYSQYIDSENRSREHSEMASRTENLTGSETQNLNQQFANYVMQQNPNEGERILTDVNDSKYSDLRNQYARDFVSVQVTPKIDEQYSQNKNGVDGTFYNDSMSSVKSDSAASEFQSNMDRLNAKTDDSNIQQGISQTVKNKQNEINLNNTNQNAIITSKQDDIQSKKAALVVENSIASVRQETDKQQTIDKIQEDKPGRNIIGESLDKNYQDNQEIENKLRK